MFVSKEHLPQILEPDCYRSQQQFDEEVARLFKPAWHYFGLQPGVFPAFALVCCIVLTVVADVTYNYVENPARKLINRLAPGDTKSPRASTNEPLDLSETRQAANAS